MDELSNIEFEDTDDRLVWDEGVVKMENRYK